VLLLHAVASATGSLHSLQEGIHILLQLPPGAASALMDAPLLSGLLLLVVVWSILPSSISHFREV
jgi:hypothetical protein